MESKGSATFAEKMSNLAFTEVCINGDRKQLKSLYQKMVRLENRKKSLIENSFYDSKHWLGNLVYRLGGNYQETYCRGTWSNLCLSKQCLSFDCETAWNAPWELLHLITNVYPKLKIYFAAEGDGWDEYLTNDDEGVFFKARFALDTSIGYEYYESIEDVSKKVSEYIGVTMYPTKGAVYEAIDKWEATNTDIDRYINLKEFKIVEL